MSVFGKTVLNLIIHVIIRERHLHIQIPYSSPKNLVKCFKVEEHVTLVVNLILKNCYTILDFHKRILFVSKYPSDQFILKQKSLATQNLVGIFFILVIKIPVLKMD